MKLAKFEAAFAAFCLRGPCERQRLGSTEDVGQFSSVTKESLDKVRDDANELLDMVEKVQPAPTEAESFRIDKVLYAQYLERILLRYEMEYNAASDLEQMPIAAERIGDSIFTLLVNDDRSPKSRVVDLVTRVRNIPKFVSECSTLLSQSIERWVDVEIQSVEGLPALFDTAQKFIDSESPERSEELIRARSFAQMALDQYIKHLKTIPTTTDFHVGNAMAERIIRARGIELSLKELKLIASNFLSKTRGEIESLRQTLIKKYGYSADMTASALQEQLADAHPVSIKNGLQDVLLRYRDEENKVLQFIQKSGLFPIPDDQSLVIMQTPTFLEPTIPAGAMLPPPPLRSGTKKSLVYLTLSDALLAEHNELSIPIMMVHEGIPGHHLQLTWAAQHPRLIRRVYDAMDLAEGWTTMLEDYMLDQGYGGSLTDEVRFMAKREMCRLAARVGIDLFFMTNDDQYLALDGFVAPNSDDPFERAGALLQSVTGFVDARVQAELNWYSRERGYPLSYLAGNHLMWALKSDFERLRGSGRETDRRFHKAVLESGNLPIALLREELLANRLISAL